MKMKNIRFLLFTLFLVPSFLFAQTDADRQVIQTSNGAAGVTLEQLKQYYLNGTASKLYADSLNLTNWKLGGNYLSSNGIFGSTNAVPLFFRTNNIDRLVIDANTGATQIRGGVRVGKEGDANLTITSVDAAGYVNAPVYQNLNFTGYNNTLKATIRGLDMTANVLKGGLQFVTVNNSGLESTNMTIIDNNVGIGTTTPQQDLEISKYKNDNVTLLIENLAYDQYAKTRLLFASKNTVGNKFLSAVQNVSDANGGRLELQTDYGSGLTPRLIVNGNGEIVATTKITTPLFKLTQDAGLGKILKSDAVGNAYWELASAQITSQSQFPIVDGKNIGDEVMTVNGQDTTVSKWDGRKWHNNIVYGQNEPLIETVNFSNREARWRRNLSYLTQTPCYKDYVVRGNEWTIESPFTPKDLGAVGDSLTDDSQAFIDLFRVLNYSGGLEKKTTNIFIPKGKYRLTTRVNDAFGYYLDRNIKMYGEDGTVIINDAPNQIQLFIFNSVAENSVTLSQPIKEKTNYYISTAVKPLIDDVINVTSTTETLENAWLYKIKDNAQVVRISGDTVFIDKPFNFPYMVQNAVVTNIRPRSVTIKNIKFKNYRSDGGGAFVIANTANSVVEDVESTNESGSIPVTVGMTFSSNVNLNVNRVKVKNIFYGIAVDGGHNEFFNAVTAIGCTGAIISPAGFSDNVVATNIVGYESNLDAHPSFRTTYENVKMFGGMIKLEGWGMKLKNVECFNRDTMHHLFGSYNSLSDPKFKYIFTDNTNIAENVTTLSPNNQSYFELAEDYERLNKLVVLKNITTNNLYKGFFSRSTVVEGGSFGHIRSRDSASYTNIQFDGELSPSSNMGFISNIDGGDIRLNNITIRNGKAKTLFQDLSVSDNGYLTNSTISGLFGLKPRTANYPDPRLKVIDCDLRDFGNNTLNNAIYINTRRDNTVLPSTVAGGSVDDNFSQLWSNIYQESGLRISNASSNGRGTLRLEGGGVTNGSGSINYNGSLNLISDRSTGSDIRFSTNDGTSLSENMRIAINGNIGGGTPNPTNKLHIVAATNPLRLEGLQVGISTDNIATVDVNGVVRQRTVGSVLSQTLKPSLNEILTEGNSTSIQPQFNGGVNTNFVKGNSTSYLSFELSDPTFVGDGGFFVGGKGTSSRFLTANSYEEANTGASPISNGQFLFNQSQSAIITKSNNKRVDFAKGVNYRSDLVYNSTIINQIFTATQLSDTVRIITLKDNGTFSGSGMPVLNLPLNPQNNVEFEIILLSTQAGVTINATQSGQTILLSSGSAVTTSISGTRATKAICRFLSNTGGSTDGVWIIKTLN